MFRVSVREPEREIVRWGPGRAWRAFLANGSIAATGRAAPGRRPPRISSDGLQTAGRRADRPRTAITRAKAQFWDGRHCGRWAEQKAPMGGWTFWTMRLMLFRDGRYPTSACP